MKLGTSMIDTSHPVRVHVGSSLAFVDIVNTIDTDIVNRDRT
jgi:hypothetical protein